jgi:hypothetical protein
LGALEQLSTSFSHSTGYPIEVLVEQALNSGHNRTVVKVATIPGESGVDGVTTPVS